MAALPTDFTLTNPILASGDLTKESIPSSQPLPAEHPSHSRGNSKEGASPQAAFDYSTNNTPKPRSFAPRGKSNSLSFPVLINSAVDNLPVQDVKAETREAKPATNALRITVPSSNESSFLTSLAAQERHVLELREELAKAEESLSNLKKQWATHESRRRDSESRRLHKMMPINPEAPQTAKFPAFAGGTTTPRAMFEEMQRRKASIDQIKPSPRRRRFSGSRQVRALSLVSPDILKRFAEQVEAAQQDDDKHEKLRSPVLLESPSQMPPTPDLIHEEDENDSETATDSQRSSRSPQQRRPMARSSMQMATDFRDGLWTFFEDLKQATYGDEARGPDSRPRAGSSAEMLVRREQMARRSGGPSRGGKPKRTVKRQTWQIRPQNSHETLVGADGQHYKMPVKQEPQPRELKSIEESGRLKEVPSIVEEQKEHPPPAPPKPPKQQPTKPINTPQRLYEKDFEGEIWQTWDTPKNESLATTPLASRSRNSSVDTTAHQHKHSNEHGRRSPLHWPALNKLKLSQLSRSTSHLMDEWEKSLSPPPTWQQVQQLQQEEERLSRPSSPRPVSKRSNSRLDESYN